MWHGHRQILLHCLTNNIRYFALYCVLYSKINYKIGYDDGSNVDDYSFHFGGVKLSSLSLMVIPSFLIIILITSYSGSITPVRTA